MDDLIKLIVEKTGISEDVAKNIPAVVMEFVQTKLPEPFASQVAGLLGGAATQAGEAAEAVEGGVQETGNTLSNLMSGISNMLGGGDKKE